MTIEISMWLTGAAQYLGAIVLLLLAVLGVAFIIFLAGFRVVKCPATRESTPGRGMWWLRIRFPEP